MDKNNKNIPIGKGTVFQTEVSFLFISPETSSRVTLASLGTVFQTGLLSCCLVVLLSFGFFWLNLPIFHICIAGELDGRDYSLTFWITTFFNIPSFNNIS